MNADNNAPDAAAAADAPNDTNPEEEQDDEVVNPEEEEDQAGNSSGKVWHIPAVSTLDSLYGLREIGREALCWQLSSAKPGNGVEQIRDQSTDTYWQSDGVSQPHWIQVQFARRVPISHICLFLDFNLDESYTPKQLTVQVGMTTQDLVPAIYPANTLVELKEPVGWCIIPLAAPPDPLDDDDEDQHDEEEGDEDEEDLVKASRKRRLVRTHLVRITILSMHQNGRDTHIRQVQLYGPRNTGSHALFSQAADAPTSGKDAALVPTDRRPFPQEFSTLAMSQFSVLR